MKHIFLVALLASLIGIQNGKAQVEVTDFGDIPLNRLAISRWQHFEWDASGSWTTIDVTTRGITPNSSADIAPIVNNIISSGSGKRILKFPAGTYQVKTGINISKGDIQIVGAGSSTKFMLAGGANPAGFSAGSSRSGNYSLSNDAARGDDKVTLTSTSGLDVGDYFIIVQAGSVTRAGASGDETQIFKIIAKSGNTLTLDIKFGIPFKKASSTIQELNYKKNLRFHNFYMEMTSKPTGGKSDNLSLNTVQNVEVSNVESNKCLNSHAQIFRAREVIFHDNNFYGNYGGGGGFQYGIKMNWSTNCHIINNVAANLRHHYATQYGSNHCVIAYNRALPPYNDYADYGQHNSKGCHNNLFEGNYGKEIYDDANPLKSWGTRYTMWYRNHATSKVGSENEFVENMNIIGNELKTASSGIKTGAPGKYTLTGANIVNISGEGGTGTMVWGSFNAGSSLSASLFLKDRPSYVARWPLYGPTATTVVNPVNQAPTGEFLFPTITSVEEGYNELYFKVDAKDPDGDKIVSVTLYIDGVLLRKEASAPFEWGQINHVNQIETQGLLAGSHLFEAEIEDEKGAKTTISTTINVTEKGVSYLTPIHDAYLQGTSPFNTGDLRVEAGNRLIYLKFDVSELKAADLEMLQLELTVSSDEGQGTISVYEGVGDQWLETTLNSSNASTKGSLASQVTGIFELEQTYKFDIPVSFLSGSNHLNLILEMVSGGNDVSFASKENETEVGPRLKIKTKDGIITKLESSLFNEESTVYPNPSQTGLFNLSTPSVWQVYNLQGDPILNGEDNSVDLSNFAKGIYFLKVNNEIHKIMYH